MRTESGSIAEVSYLAYIYRSAKYDTSNKNDTIFQLCRRTNRQKQIFHQIRKFVLDFKSQFADSNESKSGQIKLQRLFFRKPGFFGQRHKVKCIKFGEIPSRSEI